MSGQYASGIAVDQKSEPEILRLLELPPELLATIESEQPHSSLYFKTASSDLLKSQHPSSQHAVLCSREKTYQVHQIHSSNTLLLLKSPRSSDGRRSNGMTAFAGASGKLEVKAVKGDAADAGILPAIDCLRAVLPVFENERSLEHRIGSKASIYDSVPRSEEEINKAWQELRAFEQEGHAFRPSILSMRRFWSIATEAAAEREWAFPICFIDDELWMTMEDEGYPRGLYEALLQPLLLATHHWSRGVPDLLHLDPQKTIQWSRHLAEESSAQGERYSWRDLVPSQWQDDGYTDVLSSPRANEKRP